MNALTRLACCQHPAARAHGGRRHHLHTREVGRHLAQLAQPVVRAQGGPAPAPAGATRRPCRPVAVVYCFSWALSISCLASNPSVWIPLVSALPLLCQVGLLVIDEIHLLGADRGPILEVIVSRMRYIAAQVCGRVGGHLRRREAWRRVVRRRAAPVVQGRLAVWSPQLTIAAPEASPPASADRAQHPVCRAVHGAGKRTGPGRLAGHHGAGELPAAFCRQPAARLVTVGVASHACCRAVRT